MANGRHSYIRFYPSDWLGGTSRMRSRIQRSVYFDICLYNWDTAKACPRTELVSMLDDLPDWEDRVELLVSTGKIVRNQDGSVENPRAMATAKRAMGEWEKMSAGGKGGSKGVGNEVGKGDNNHHGNGDAQDLAQDLAQEPRTKNQEPEIPSESIYTPRRIFDAWNAMAKEHGLSVAVRLNDTRTKALRVRLDEHEGAQIVAAIGMIPQSDFLMGRTGTGDWRATIDWLCQPSSMLKLLEGAYHGGGTDRKGARASNGKEDGFTIALREAGGALGNRASDDDGGIAGAA